MPENEESKVQTHKPKTSSVTWGPVVSILGTIGAFLFGNFIMGSTLFLIIMASTRWSYDKTVHWTENSVFAQFLVTLVVYGSILGAITWFVHFKKSNLRALGLVRVKLSDLGRALIAFGIYSLVYFAITILIKILIPSLNLDQQQQIGFDAARSSGQLVLVFISLVVLPPLVEEILCRGFLYSGLRTKFTYFWSMMITSIIFASAHLQFGLGVKLLWVAAIDTFILSIFLVYLREKTGSLWSSIFLHGIKNGVAFLVLFVFAVR